MKDLIKSCLYYKGETECPKEISDHGLALMWDYEQMWVEREDLHGDNAFNTIEYIKFGLANFNEDDGVPMTLKALLFNRHSHWTGGYSIEEDVESFKEWYFTYYLRNASKE